MATDSEKTQLPAYIAYSFLTSFFNGLRDSSIPLQIDRTVMPKASGSQVSAAVTSLKFLKMIDGNNKPTELMRQLVKATDEARGPLWKKILEGAYPFVFNDDQFDLTRGTGSMMAEKFRAQGLQGATLSKAIAFFLAAAKASGIEVSPHIKPPAVPAPKAGGKRNRKEDDYEEEEEEDSASHDLDVQKFQIPIPGKASAVFTIPKDLSDEEWKMLKTMLDAYITLLQKRQA